MRTAVLLCILAANVAAAPVDFVREIKPVLERSCVQCHGPDKEKGALRLETREALFKGGDSGAAIAPGKPEESELYRRVTLAEKHEDVMPPSGKAEHLTAAEAQSFKRWIAEGAPWPDGIIAVAVKKPAPAIAGPPPSPAELAARAELARHGVRVRPSAAGTNWTRASFRTASSGMPAEAFEQLRQLATLSELDLGGAKITDEQLAHVADLANLTALNLSQTEIGDAGLDHLAKLQKLSSLNLFGTRISDAGVAKLSQLNHLQRLYVAGTAVTGPALAALKSALPGLTLDRGSDFAELAKIEFFGPPKPPEPEKAAGPAK